MNILQIQREKIRQLVGILPLAEPHERLVIRTMVRKNQIRLALLVLQRQFEKDIDGPFDSGTSRKLDALKVLLDD